MICPKCKNENDNNATICTHCGFKLKIKCPHCGTLNTIGNKFCENCKKQILIKCPSCNSINFATATVCRKCSTTLSSKRLETNSNTNIEKKVSVAIELINISSIKTNVKSQELATKVISKFYQVFASAAKSKSLKPLKINESSLLVQFDNSPSFIDGIEEAVNFVESIDNSLDEISELLEKKLKISYKVRYLVSTFSPSEKDDILASISLGVVDDIIFSDQIYLHLKEKMPFKEISTHNNIMFYKFLDENDPETLTTEIPKEIPQKTRMDIINDMYLKMHSVQTGFVACLNGPTGIGKSNIFNALKQTFKEDNSKICLLGQCSLQATNSPLYFFKDMLKNLFDIPAFTVDINATKLRIQEYLNNNLSVTDENLINNIFSIIFFDETSLQNNIYVNKQKTYTTITSLFRILLQNKSVVLHIEDIEYIDKFSLEIIRNLFEEGILKCDLKIFVTSNIDVDIIQFFASQHLNKDNTYFAQYPVLTKEEIDSFINQAIKSREALGLKLLNHIYEHSKGMPVFIEEFLYSLLQFGLLTFTTDSKNPLKVSPELDNMNLPKSAQEVIQLRLTNISNRQPNAFKAIYYASILGPKFLPAIVQNILQISDDEFTEIIKFLSVNNFIEPVDTYNYAFKNRTIWETVRNLQLTEENKKNGVVATVNSQLQITTPDMSTLINNLISVNVPKYEILNYIEQATKEAYSIGDDYSYIDLKALLIEGVELSTLENKQQIILAIKEELLNITYQTFPDIAVKYGTDLINYHEALDEVKTINILGLMSLALENIGNYTATLECIDKVLEKIDSTNNKIATMLLNHSKLSGILHLGRNEELISIARTIILPTIDLYEKNKIKEKTNLLLHEFILIKLDTLYYLALAYALQGSIKSLETAQILAETAQKEENDEYILKSNLVISIFKTIQGENDEAQNLLDSLQPLIPTSKNSTINTLIWVIIKNLIKFFKGEYNEIQNELFAISNFCINTKKFALAPIIKSLIIKIVLFEGNIQLAENIASEEFYKCSNNKWTLGALANWYMYSEISTYKENYDEALKVAQIALDVAEKANTNNLFFTSLLKLKIAQIYAIRDDLDMAKINAEEALQIAEANGYNLIKAMSANVSYDILLKQIQHNPNLKNENINLLYNHLIYAQDAVNKLKNPDLSLKIKQKIDDIFKFAQENGIAL